MMFVFKHFLGRTHNNTLAVDSRVQNASSKYYIHFNSINSCRMMETRKLRGPGAGLSGTLILKMNHCRTLMDHLAPLLNGTSTPMAPALASAFCTHDKC